ncbi:hypothetical protein [Sphingomonas sp.]|uniref:hypothetical protein n=1 Tax=Sphingomonas sp. TaxID=28214 RepID=UPI002899765F|nr:hypothetical protein [Sphingomonas sp.]
MDENGIKAVALARIRREARGRNLPVVTSEFSLNGTGIRADLALLDRDTFYGVEIKSASDTLKRLPSQMEGYARYFDRTELIVAPKHLDSLGDIDLYGAKVWRAEASGNLDVLALGDLRRISGQWLLHLLTAEDERRANRAIEQHATELSPIDIDHARRAEFGRAFHKRYGPTSNRFWEAVRGRPIRVEDLKLLSRYHAERQQRQEIERERAQRWATWVEAMQSPSHAI